MQTELLKSPLGRFRIIAFVEGCSYLLLGVTMVLKYGMALPKPNYIVGMTHGLLFIVYVILLVQVAFIHKWSLVKTGLAFLASLIPFGTFYADKKLFTK
ncbi:MAG: DUF3817 domain-containing protein [Cytophagaceae bacterium]|nr:DUF3817 domain-containing protein [Cytophagaceae bacterium]